MNFNGTLLIIAAGIWYCIPANAQDAEDTPATSITYEVTTEAATGTGDYTASLLTANRHHVLGTRSNTAYLRGALQLKHTFGNDLALSGEVDAIGGLHADHQIYLQQCYARLSWKSFFVEAGSHEEKQVVRDDLLSSGSFVKGTNAKPIPQLHVGTSDFWTVPYTKDWLQVNFDFGYGKFLDSGFREQQFNDHAVNKVYAKDIWYHQKHLYFRSNPTKPIFVTVGIEHFVQFGGTKYFRDPSKAAVKKSLDLKSFWKVILPVGDSQYFENGAMEDWVWGNHVGVMTYQIGWNINENHQLQAYLDNPFEDGSGVRKGNGWDGLWGLQYTNKTAGRQLVRGAVLEYFQSTNQSGPLHWDSGDYPDPIRHQITDLVTGKDDYYKHSFYINYAHYDMVIGNPLITSPIYNGDGYAAVRDNRVKAWNLGINGEFNDRLTYLVKGYYKEGWGTYDQPLIPKRHSFAAMLQGTYHTGPWLFSAAYALDNGNIFGDVHTFDFKIRYHGKIL